METLRFQVVGEAFKKKPLDVKTPSERPAKYFGKKVFKTLVPRNVRLAEAPSYGMSIYDYDKNSKGSKAYEALANEVIKRLK